MKTPTELLTVVGSAVLAIVVASAQEPPAPSQGAAQGPQDERAPEPPSGPPSQFADPEHLPPVLRDYRNLTRQRLLQPEDENWLMIRRTYDGWGYSPLEGITPSNVSRLKLVWSQPTGEVGAHQSPPLVNNGVMFVSTPNNQVAPYDAKTGTLLWRYQMGANLHGTSPVTFMLDGRQMIVVPAGTTLTAWALPDVPRVPSTR